MSDPCSFARRSTKAVGESTYRTISLRPTRQKKIFVKERHRENRSRKKSVETRRAQSFLIYERAKMPRSDRYASPFGVRSLSLSEEPSSLVQGPPPPWQSAKHFSRYGAAYGSSCFLAFAAQPVCRQRQGGMTFS